jgi:hypothetical protein
MTDFPLLKPSRVASLRDTHCRSGAAGCTAAHRGHNWFLSLILRPTAGVAGVGKGFPIARLYSLGTMFRGNRTFAMGNLLQPRQPWQLGVTTRAPRGYVVGMVADGRQFSSEVQQ